MKLVSGNCSMRPAVEKKSVRGSATPPSRNMQPANRAEKRAAGAGNGRVSRSGAGLPRFAVRTASKKTVSTLLRIMSMR